VNEVAGPSATQIASPATPVSPWSPAVIACVALIALAGGSLTYALGAGFQFPNLVPVLLLATAFMAAVRWKRAGVRRQLRSRAAARISEFGGGVYGAMAVATLLQLEAADLVNDVASAGSLAKFVGALDVGWLMQQMMESIGFAIRAAMWPWHWFSDYGMYAVLLAAGAAVGLDALMKAVFPGYRAHREAPAVATAG
jgi:hypothetical protein